MLRREQRLRDAVAGLCRGALDLVLPPACASCGRAVESDRSLCHPCQSRLAWIPDGLCELCEERPGLPGGSRCAACALSGSPLAAVVAAVRFDGDATAWIHRFKYPRPGLRGLDPAAQAVCRSLIRHAGRRIPAPPPDLIVPVPLHPRRLRSRGFNPACTLARALAREIGAPVDPVALRRIRDTPSQTGLDRSARRRNVRRAFSPRRTFEARECVWLVDDVVTTGSTLNECARVLSTAGAHRIVAITAARATNSS